jgi:hypothetical protein
MWLSTSLPFPKPCFVLTRLDIGGSLGVHQECHDKTVQTQDFGENENQNHSNEESGLLSVTTNASVTDNTDSET